MKEHYYLINSTIKYKNRKYKKTYYATITKTKCQYYFIFFNKTIGNKLQGLEWIITRDSITKYSLDINYKQLKKQIEHDNINNIIKKSNNKIEKCTDLIIDFKEINKYENIKI